jgi:hypothetical protein
MAGCLVLHQAGQHCHNTGGDIKILLLSAESFKISAKAAQDPDNPSACERNNNDPLIYL